MRRRSAGPPASTRNGGARLAQTTRTSWPRRPRSASRSWRPSARIEATAGPRMLDVGLLGDVAVRLCLAGRSAHEQIDLEHGLAGHQAERLRSPPAPPNVSNTTSFVFPER